MCPKEAEALETGARLFEDLEFQQLEQESRLEEEREARGQQLLRSRAECHHSIARRKVGTERGCGAGVAGLPCWPWLIPPPAPQERVAALDAQAAQVRLQSTLEAERLARERSGVLQLLQKVMLHRGAAVLPPTLGSPRQGTGSRSSRWQPGWALGALAMGCQ